jgi:hypothetical protein
MEMLIGLFQKETIENDYRARKKLRVVAHKMGKR